MGALPDLQLRRRLLEGHAAELFDLARAFGQRHELVRPDDAAQRMLPAHQRLGADDAACRQFADRLVVHADLAVLDGFLQILLGGLGQCHDRARRGAIGFDTVAAMALGIKHGQLGITQDVGGAGLAVVEDRHAERSRHGDVAFTESEGRADGLAQLIRHFGDLVGGLFRTQDDAELVRAEPGHGVERPHLAPDAAGNGQKHGIGAGLTQTLDDAGELVDVDEEHGRLGPLAEPGPLEGVFQPVRGTIAGSAGRSGCH